MDEWRGIMMGLGDLAGGGFFSYAYGVSGDGSTVVGVSSNGGYDAFVWTPGGGMESLYDLLVRSALGAEADPGPARNPPQAQEARVQDRLDHGLHD